MDLGSILTDASGANEVAVRQAIDEVEGHWHKMIEESPDFTTGEAALAFAVAFEPYALGWMVAVLLRDRMEFGG